MPLGRLLRRHSGSIELRGRLGQQPDRRRGGLRLRAVDNAELCNRYERTAALGAGGAHRPDRDRDQRLSDQPELERVHRRHFVQDPALARRQHRLDAGRHRLKHQLQRHRAERRDHVLLSGDRQQQRRRLSTFEHRLCQHRDADRLHAGAAGQLGGHLWRERIRAAGLERQHRPGLAAGHHIDPRQRPAVRMDRLHHRGAGAAEPRRHDAPRVELVRPEPGARARWPRTSPPTSRAARGSTRRSTSARAAP